MPEKLKFRVWNGETMISPNYIDREGRAHWTEDGIPRVSDKVMQWTGLLDRNGTEIYEGDIVQFTYWWFDGNPAESLLSGTIVYLPEVMSFGLEGVKNEEWCRHIGGDVDTAAFGTWRFDGDDFSVVGNFYEQGERA